MGADTHNHTHLPTVKCRFQMLLVGGILDHETMSIGQTDVIFWILHLAVLGREVAVHNHGGPMFPPGAAISRSLQVCYPDSLESFVLPPFGHVYPRPWTSRTRYGQTARPRLQSVVIPNAMKLPSLEIPPLSGYSEHIPVAILPYSEYKLQY